MNKKFIIVGVISGLVMVFVYFVILSIANSFSHALDQFFEIWYWILALSVGFGIQVGLYSFVKTSFRTVAISGGISTGSMVACCLHHLVDVLPLMGLTVAVVFLIKYQTLFFVIGILSSIVSIIIMLEIVQKNNLSEGLLKKIAIVSSLILVVIVFAIIGGNSSETIKLLSRESSQNNITFTATPIDFDLDNLVKFEIKIETHSGSLDFDLTKVSILEDNKGNRYQPLAWDGSPAGGHHRSGVISFPKLIDKTKNIKLIIQDNSNLPLRIFEWDLE